MSKMLDTRDLDKRKEELEALRDAVTEAESEIEQIRTRKPDEDESLADYEAWQNELGDAELVYENATNDFTDDEKAELAELENLESEISEWRHGEAMIPESEFTDYIMETLEDCGTLPKDLPWYIAIDRDETAENCKADYSEVEYQGTTYLVRNC